MAEIDAWLDAALAQPARQSWLDHDGVRLNLRQWGPDDAPGVVLVHGGAAHSHWWDHIGPWLAHDRCVVALDLSGHGDSGWRDEGYVLDAWAGEVAAVAARLRDPVLIGHSLGGLVVLKAALQDEVPLAGAVVLDVVARYIGSDEQARRQRRADRASRLFPSRDSAIAAFRTLPDAGERQIPAIIRHIAETSVRHIDGGWTWKTDRKVFLRDSLPLQALTACSVQTDLVAAEHGLLDRERAMAMAERLGDRSSVSVIAEAGHHIMIDQPVALTRHLESQLQSWSRA